MQQKLCGHFYEYPEVTFRGSDHSVQFPGTASESKICCNSFNLHPELRLKLQHSLLSQITAQGVKYPLADFNITPDVAIVDPALVAGLPAKQVAYTGMDASDTCD